MSIYGNETNAFAGGYCPSSPANKASNAFVHSPLRARDTNPLNIGPGWDMISTAGAEENIRAVSLTQVHYSPPDTRLAIFGPGWFKVGGFTPTWSAPWNFNAVQIQDLTAYLPGIYGNSASVIVQGNLVTPTGSPDTFTSPVAINSRLYLISRDLTQIVEVTPPGGIDPINVGIALRGNQVRHWNYDTVALFGRRTAFFPRISLDPVADPGLYPVVGINSAFSYSVDWTSQKTG